MDELILKQYTGTKYEDLTLANDFMFGKVMRDRKNCKGLLERIFPEMDIERIEFPETQKTFLADIDAKGIRMDVYVRDENGTVYNIEMQATDTKELPKRSRYYQANIDLDAIDKGKPYRELSDAYVIFVCLENPFVKKEQKKKRHVYTFRNICREDPRLALGDGATKIFLCADGTMDDVNPELRCFLNYLAGSSPADEFTKSLDDAVNHARGNKKWRSEYMKLQLILQDVKNEGHEEGTISALVGLVNHKKISLDSAADEVGMSVESFLEKAKKIGMPISS